MQYLISLICFYISSSILLYSNINILIKANIYKGNICRTHRPGPALAVEYIVVVVQISYLAASGTVLHAARSTRESVGSGTDSTIGIGIGAVIDSSSIQNGGARSALRS